MQEVRIKATNALTQFDSIVARLRLVCHWPFPNCVRIPGCNWESQWHTNPSNALRKASERATQKLSCMKH